ncbi:ATP-binding protein [Streptomyces sp. NPDC056161]|uniref:ATP-binding protein n=1 Tax=Streptomyces sp. NPDC056161 TaxID=3345732 RepID=UPI0035E2FFC4
MSQSTTSRTCPGRLVEPRTAAWPQDSAAQIQAHTFQAAFLPDPPAVADMRASAARFLVRSGVCEPVADDVVLVVSELVTNAVQYGGDHPVELAIRAVEGVLSVSVTDGNPAPAVLKRAGADDENGRGMALVEAFADDWGSTGQETWAIFRCETAREAK